MKLPGMRFCLLFIFVALINAGAHAQVPAQTMPEFKFLQLDQKPFTDKNLPEHKMLFFLFFDPGCEHCQRTVEYINKHYQLFAKTAMIMVSMDSVAKIKKFMAFYGPGLQLQKNVTIVQDKQYQFITRFKPKKYPAMFLYSAGKKLLDFQDSDEAVSRIVNTINKNSK